MNSAVFHSDTQALASHKRDNKKFNWMARDVGRAWTARRAGTCRLEWRVPAVPAVPAWADVNVEVEVEVDVDVR